MFLLGYFITINLVTFILWGIDKRKAVREKRRVREKTLLLCCALGGFLGAILAMGIFRHKTVKSKFLVWFYLIVGGWLIVVILYSMMN